MNLLKYTLNERTRIPIAKHVVAFVAESRKKSYVLGAEPNFPTGDNRDYGFRYTNSGLVYLDVTREQDDVFTGNEYVAAESTGDKFYICQYAGGDVLGIEDIVPRVRVQTAQHRLVIENPTYARFGSTNVRLETIVDGMRFVYTERGNPYTSGRSNTENMSLVIASKRWIPVFSASSQTTVFKTK